MIGSGSICERALCPNTYRVQRKFHRRLAMVRLIASHPGEPGFAFGDRAGRCRRSAGFLGDFPFPAHAIRHCIVLTSCSPSPALNTSMLRVTRTSPLPHSHTSVGCPRQWGRGGLAVRLLASNQGEPGSISLKGRSRNRVGRCRWPADFLGDRQFSPPLQSPTAPYSPHLTLIGSQDLDFKCRPNLSTPLGAPCVAGSGNNPFHVGQNVNGRREAVFGSHALAEWLGRIAFCFRPVRGA
ncbi:hypothetical protein PR048_015174 [Dryococelus australis]|uniref:Uncharacterized protein n=1 Tax=Dryococelus australis TaxID=614101 RepID=A0ABQ9HG83_9NEOP|nr:hypothetical protein PR048_015174 [Dryococelus australis]